MLFVCNTRNDCQGFYVGECSHHHQTNNMHRCFSLVYQNQFGGAKGCYLSYHLASYGACCTGNHNNFTGQEFSYSLHVHLDLVTR